MYAHAISNILSNLDITRRCFKGTLPINKLHYIKNRHKHFYIINSKPSYHKGEHWLCVFLSGQKSCEIYDPLIDKNRQYYKYITTYLKKYTKIKTIKSNNKATQHILAQTCGYHCVLFGVLRCYGIAFSKILQFLYTMPSHNFRDNVVMSFVKHIQSGIKKH